ncbi:MAG: substrate-binding domain-containing protein [Abditibacteriales bacterium]|nr:substrate-binding domain-containing protein [Abditibacteriales bacterium]MDW8364429.1 substrate-binding domain-containing protein [Abditibacteriales bacterium]
MSLTGRWWTLASVLLLCGVSGAGSPVPQNSGKRIRVAMIPKLKGISYFNACERGAREAAEELGNVQLIYDGPLKGRVDDQIRIIDNWITQKVDVIAFAANDPDAIAPTLKKARQKGIHVIGYDADANPKSSGREFFVNQATFQAIGYELVDEMARQVGPRASVALISSDLNAPNQKEWTKWMKKRMKEKYPQMKLVAEKYPGEDRQRAMRMTQEVLNAFPDVKGVWGISSVAFPGAADAVKQMGLKGKVAVVGLSTPKDMRPFVKDGVVKTVILWNPVDLGYLTIYAARAVYDGTLKRGMKSFKAGRLGTVKVDGDQILLGPPMKFDRSNIDKFDF